MATPSSPKRRRLSREPHIPSKTGSPTPSKLPLSTRRNGLPPPSPKKLPIHASGSPIRKRRPVIRTPPPAVRDAATPPPSPTSAMLLRRIRELETANADLSTAVKSEQTRVTKLSAPVPDGPIDSLIASLLSSNDASLPPPPTKVPVFDFTLALADPTIPSLLPLPSTDPIKQLTAFSTLHFTAISTSPHPTTPHLTTTTVAGHTAKNTLFFRLSFSVNTQALTVLALDCTISAWARPELTPTITRARADKDPGLLLYALDSYSRLAATRASVWAELARTYSARGLCGGATSARGFLGSAVFVLKRKVGVEFVVRWRIEVDDVGEAESVVGGDVRVPRSWGKETGREVAGLVEGLVESRGVVMAVEVVVGLLWT